MAQKIASANITAAEAAAQNSSHAQLAGSLYIHNDGPEWSDANPPVEDVLSGGSPTTLSGAISTLNSARTLFNNHLGFYDATSGDHIYAHNSQDTTNPITTAAMSSESTYTTPMLTAAITLAQELTTDYIAHIANLSAHGAADTLNVPGTTYTMTTADHVAERLNLLKALFNDHIILTAGGIHGASGSTDNCSTANASATDWDSIKTLANALKLKFNAHLAQGAAIHTAADATNTTSASDVAYTSGLFDLGTEMITKLNAHFGSAVFHNAADTTTIAASTPSTVALLITLAAEVYTDLTAHLRAAPLSRAVRRV